VIWLQTHTVVWLHLEESFLSSIERTWLNGIRQTEIHTAEPLVPEPNAFELEMAIEKLKRHKSPGIDQIPAELIKAGGRIFTLKSIKLLIPYGIRRNCLRSGSSRLLYLFIKRVINKTEVILLAYHFCQLHTKCYPTSCCQS